MDYHRESSRDNRLLYIQDHQLGLYDIHHDTGDNSMNLLCHTYQHLVFLYIYVQRLILLNTFHPQKILNNTIYFLSVIHFIDIIQLIILDVVFILCAQRQEYDNYRHKYQSHR